MQARDIEERAIRDRQKMRVTSGYETAGTEVFVGHLNDYREHMLLTIKHASLVNAHRHFVQVVLTIDAAKALRDRLVEFCDGRAS